MFSLKGALGVNLKSQGIIALVGRDVLQDCILNYDGKLAEITLAV